MHFHQKEKMTSRHFCVSLLVGQTLWVLPIYVYVRTRNLWISLAVMGIEIILGAILLVLWVWSSTAISDFKEYIETKKTEVKIKENR